MAGIDPCDHRGASQNGRIAGLPAMLVRARTTGEGSSGPSLVGVDERLTRDEHIGVVCLGRGRRSGWDDDLTAERVRPSS